MFGNAYSECILNATLRECEGIWKLRQYELERKYPKSLFISILNRIDLVKGDYSSSIHPSNGGTFPRRGFLETAVLEFRMREYNNCLLITGNRTRTEVKYTKIFNRRKEKDRKVDVTAYFCLNKE